MKHITTMHLYELMGVNGISRQIATNDFRPYEDLMKDRIWVGQVELEIDWPELDSRQLQIDKLEAQVEKERADSQVRVNLLLERISKLKCLEHKQ